MKEQAIKENATKAIRDIYPEHIDGEVGVGKFRMTIHRVYTAGDGWLMGDKKVYVIAEVMNKLIKISTYTDGEELSWAFHSESGGSWPLKNAQKDVFGHKIKSFEISQSHREAGTLYDSLK